MGDDRLFCLLISCSQRKRSVEKSVGALELYDGHYYRIIRKLMRESHFPSSVHIAIISAQYGVLRESDPVLPYDRKMTACRATNIKDQILTQLVSVFGDKQYQEVFVNLGRHYLAAVAGFESLLPDTTKIIYASGGIGQRGAQMKKWILSKEPSVCLT